MASGPDVAAEGQDVVGEAPFGRWDQMKWTTHAGSLLGSLGPAKLWLRMPPSSASAS